MWRDLIDVAQQLCQDVEGNPPTQAAIRRSISTSYYALFTRTSLLVADTLAKGAAKAVPTEGWVRAHRCLNHGEIKKEAKILSNSNCILAFTIWADAILTLQEARHRADYDPTAHFLVEESEDCVGLSISGCSALSDLPPDSALDLVSRLAFRDRK